MYEIKVMIERIGLKRQRKNVPKSWGIERAVFALSERDAFEKICALYRDRKNRHYKITLRECNKLVQGNDNTEKLERYTDEIV